MTFEEFKKIVIAASKEVGVTDFELYYARESSTSVSIFKHEVNQFESGLSGGVSYRALVKGHMGYASTEKLDADEARRIVSAAVANAESLETDEQEFLVEGGKTYREPQARDFTLPAADELLKKALSGQEALYAADPLVVDGCETEAVAFQSSVAIVNSRGLDLKHETKNAVLVSAAVVSDGKEMQNAYEMKGGELSSISEKELVEKAVTAAKNKLGADVAPTGAYPVVFSPKAFSSLLSTYSGVFSAEAARRGLSRLKGREGEVIASEKVTLTDDPFYPESPSQRPFDAEGTPTFTKNVVENGRLLTLLYNLKTAAALGKETTGNASRGSYAAPVSISPFTFYLAPGEYREEELLKMAGEGVYIDFLGGLHAGANPISGDFSLQSAGFMIHGGEKAEAVKSFTVAGNFFDLLKGVRAVGDQVEYRGMGSATSFASPPVLVDGLSIAGK